MLSKGKIDMGRVEVCIFITGVGDKQNKNIYVRAETPEHKKLLCNLAIRIAEESKSGQPKFI